MKAIVSWSGGKDSCFAALLAQQHDSQISVLLNVMNETGQRSRSHGLPASVLQQQASVAALPIHLVESSWQDYESRFTESLQTLKTKYEAEQVVFGDIDLQAHRDWEEKVCTRAGLTALLPLWQQDRKTLLLQMLESGIQCRIVSCQQNMGPRFLGRMLDIEMIPELEALGVDPCGENGEFHTVVVDCPLFKSPITINYEGFDEHNAYYFLRWKE